MQVNDITHGLEGKEGNTHWERQFQQRDRRATAQQIRKLHSEKVVVLKHT